ncbi:hypothetical protein AYI70_g6254 [Smittium culicis]|uniref:Uncharacterized protein n=1 Tax=Smittium culicis TaxID=133412 RepID=A0A1R1XQR6_9FUNG|nr:hypothetical protein AYI70_g6254 [Smittium culicis]
MPFTVTVQYGFTEWSRFPVKASSALTFLLYSYGVKVLHARAAVKLSLTFSLGFFDSIAFETIGLFFRSDTDVSELTEDDLLISSRTVFFCESDDASSSLSKITSKERFFCRSVLNFWFGGQTDFWFGGQADFWFGGQADFRIRGQSDIRTS